MKRLIFALLACFASLAVFAASPQIIENAFAQGNQVYVNAQEQLWVEVAPGRWATELENGMIKFVAVNKDGYRAMVDELEDDLRVAAANYAETQSKRGFANVQMLTARLESVITDMEKMSEETDLVVLEQSVDKTDCLISVTAAAFATCSAADAYVDVFTHHCQFNAYARAIIRDAWGSVVCDQLDTGVGSRFGVSASCSGWGYTSMALARAYRVDDTSVVYMDVDREICGGPIP